MGVVYKGFEYDENDGDGIFLWKNFFGDIYPKIIHKVETEIV